MRNFIISLICLLVTLCSWTAFSVYSAKTTDVLQAQSHHLVYSSINNGDWTSAEKDYLRLSKTWNKYKSAAVFFLDSREINEIECTMDKAYLYMKAQDISNSSGEFSSLKDKFKFLHQNDSVTLSNIF